MQENKKKKLDNIEQAIKLAGLPGQLYYTPRQLYYASLRASPSWRFFAPCVSDCFDAFLDDLQEYLHLRAAPPGLMNLPASPPFLVTKGDAPDLHDYGLSSLVLCQHDDIAAMLIQNQFHLEFGCAILGLSSARPLPDVLCAMLGRAGRPRIFFLHDASLDALALIPYLPEYTNLPGNFPIISAGLRPSQAMRWRLPYHHQKMHQPENFPCLPWYLNSAEKQWLQAGKSVELAALPPAQLLNILREAISQGEVPSIL